MMANVNFVILKINDIDVGQLPEQEQRTALTTLLNDETENIVLQLKRKSFRNASKNINHDDLDIGNKMCYLKIHQNTSPLLENNTDNSLPSATIDPDIIVNLHLPTSSLQQYCITKSTQTEDISFYVHEHLRNMQKDTERLIEHEHNLFEQSVAPEIDIEEITLRKSDSNERLGITVCYSNADDYADGGVDHIGRELYLETVVTEVYISDIHPDSIAGRDGRLRQGDQILQINGKDIKTRPETETLIAENNNADEEDFNDPSTNEDEDEVLVVEDDEDDEDDDDFYEENNKSYVNCLINNVCCINSSDDLGKGLMSEVSHQDQQNTLEKPKEKYNLNIFSNPVYQSNSLKWSSGSQKEKFSKIERKWSTGLSNVKCVKKTKSNTLKMDVCQDNKSHIDYETEHIYETIPEDPESEPFYCSPYDSSVYVTAMASCSSSTITDALQHLEQKQRVEQWLGIKPGICATTTQRYPQRSTTTGERSSTLLNKNTIDTAVTTITNGSADCVVTNITLPANFHIEDQDNSSSAYNTGGSNNSFSPLTLILNPKNRTEENNTSVNSTVSGITNGATDDILVFPLQKTSVQQKINSPKEKSKTSSPKGTTFQQKINTGVHKMAVIDAPSQPNVDKVAPINIHQNMLVKQHLINQKLSLEKSLQSHPLQQRTQCYYQQHTDQIQCPQFTAPNLSQYHFVSSQEVNNFSLSNKGPKSSTTIATATAAKDEDTMVWKVKRRPDGTRYIVRRPAKNRIIKDRTARTNAERLRNDITTTEDDTISEIKTGRYWTREERKKHIEKARERRQYHHQQLLQQQKCQSHLQYNDLTSGTLCIKDVTNKLVHDPCERERRQQYMNFIKQQHIPSHQAYYQLQFNSAVDNRHSTSLQNSESPTKKSSSTLQITSDEFSSLNRNVDEFAVLNPIAFTPSEHSEISSSLQSVTTT